MIASGHNSEPLFPLVLWVTLLWVLRVLSVCQNMGKERKDCSRKCLWTWKTCLSLPAPFCWLERKSEYCSILTTKEAGNFDTGDRSHSSPSSLTIDMGTTLDPCYRSGPHSGPHLHAFDPAGLSVNNSLGKLLSVFQSLSKHYLLFKSSFIGSRARATCSSLLSISRLGPHCRSVLRFLYVLASPLEFPLLLSRALLRHLIGKARRIFALHVTSL